MLWLVAQLLSTDELISFYLAVNVESFPRGRYIFHIALDIRGIICDEQK